MPSVGRLQYGEAVHDLIGTLEELTANTFPALVGLLVEVVRILLVNALDERLHATLVGGVGRANELVVGDAEALPRCLERGGDSVDEGLRRDTTFVRRLLHFLAVLVHPHEEMDVVPSKAAIAGE